MADGGPMVTSNHAHQSMITRSANDSYSAEAGDLGHAEQPTLHAPDQDRRQAANRPDLRITRRLALGGPQLPGKPKFDTQDKVRRRRAGGSQRAQTLRHADRHEATEADCRSDPR